MTSNSSKFPSNGSATVKQILSGDAIVLRGRAVNGPPPERTIYLNNINSPRMGTAKEPEKEEQGAFETREFLRKLLVGKVVSFQIDYTTNSSRDYGTIKIPTTIEDETDVASILVKKGLVKVKSADGRHAPSEDHAKLLELEKQAIAKAIGLHGQAKSIRKVLGNLENTQDFFRKYKGKKLNAILEQVRDGSTLRPLVFLENSGQQTVCQYLNFQISGIKAPTFRKDVPGVEDSVEPHGEEAKFFVESRLLQKDIEIIVEGVNNNFVIGSVVFHAGNIAETLLAEGLAKVADWSLAMVTDGPHKLRQAENKAKAKRIRLWKNFVNAAGGADPSNADANAATEFDAIVCRVITPDTILIENIVTGKEKKISFSSLKAPKLKESNESYYHQEAKELVRSKLIGKKVHVNVEFVKPAQESYEERECATVKLGCLNIAELLVSQGLATVVRHKSTDMNRSSCYDSLLVAEEKAKTEQKGIHSNTEPPANRIADASENVSKAKQFLPFLQRAGVMSGVIEHCFNAGRFKILVPSQNCRFTFVFSGLRVPKTGRTPADKSDPFGPEALQYVQRNVLQRNAQIIIEDVDRVGSFIGQIFIESSEGSSSKAGSSNVRTGSPHAGDNIGLQLVSKGLSSVHEASASRSSFGRDLLDAEKHAKNGRIGIWSQVDPNALRKEDDESDKNAVDFSASLSQDKKMAIVSNISENIISVQVLSDELDNLEKLMADFSLHHKGIKDALAFSATGLRAGDYVSAQFTADDQWYRAQIKKVNPDKTFLVSYIDYGNQEILSATRLRPLESPFKVNNLSAQSKDVELAYIRIPGLAEDYGQEAFEILRDLTEGKTLTLKTVSGSLSSQQQKPTSVLLYDGAKLINESMVAQGVAVVQKQLVKEYEYLERSKSAVDRLLNQKQDIKTVVDLIRFLVNAQDESKSNRLNMWQYGDITADDEEY